MTNTPYACCDSDRLDAVSKHATLNGIAYLDVSEDQRELLVHFANDRRLADLKPRHILIEGGERIPNVAVLKAEVLAADPRVLAVTVAQPGDFSVYTLRLVDPAEPADPPADFDPVLSSIRFSFKVSCPADFDCRPRRECPPEPLDEPDVDYLAKDYAGYRRLMLDRMSALMPGWRERNPSDAGVALVELLAYVADRLSYQQDAVATEAYLGTARKRTSVRRHARLVDYVLDEGCNARAWVHLRVSAAARLRLSDPITGAPIRHRFLTRCLQEGPLVDPARLPDLLRAHKPEVFEPLHEADLHPAHNEMRFHTWGARNCCLPAGATAATLSGDFGATLRQGDVLLFEEVVGPRTGQRADADPSHRHAARLSQPPRVRLDPLTGESVTEIAWHLADALPFPVCVSATTDADHGAALVTDVSVARGNAVLVDHGLSIDGEPIGGVPDPVVFLPPLAADLCELRAREPLPSRFRPALANAPLTFQGAVMVSETDAAGRARRVRAFFDPGGPAAGAFAWQPRDALPAITLGDSKGRTWRPRRDLLNSAASAEEFAVEVENDGTARLRFGDDVHGARPAAGAWFTADYRVGNGAQGNVGADAIAHLATAQADLASAVAGARNPLAARGGAEPESIEDARKNAPQAFRIQERAVTADDYAEVTQRQADLRIQRAAASFRWTGSWRTVFVTADRDECLPVGAGFETALRDRLERYRMAGHDLEVDAPRFVPLDIVMQVCVKPDYFRADVKAELLSVFGNRRRADGRLGVFHPDRFTFGQSVYLSQLYAAAMAVEGVESARITRFRRLGSQDTRPLQDGVLTLARLEIARLDNDPNFPERGRFRLDASGGK